MVTDQGDARSKELEILGKKYPLITLVKYDIIGGPSLLDLIVSYAYARDKRDARPVKFALKSAVNGSMAHCFVMLNVLSLCYDMVNGDRLRSDGHSIEGVAWPVIGHLEDGYTNCRAFYNIDAQTGYLYACEQFPL